MIYIKESPINACIFIGHLDKGQEKRYHVDTEFTHSMNHHGRAIHRFGTL